MLAAYGFLDPSVLPTFREFASPLGLHPDRLRVTGVEISSGSLGHGLALGLGTALALRLQRRTARTVVLIGDGELDEGSNHEAIAVAGRLGLDRLTVIVIDNSASTAMAGRHRGTVRGRGLAYGGRRRARPRRHRSGVAAGAGPPERGRGPDRGRIMMRAAFVDAAIDLLESPRRCGGRAGRDLGRQLRRGPARLRDRIIDVGIREQALVGVAGGLALAGMRPIVHTFAPFLVERAFEQIKLDLSHQDVPAVLVSIGASYDEGAYGRTHQAPGDVALLSTLGDWRIEVPAHADDVGALLRRAVAAGGRTYLRLSENGAAWPGAAAARSGCSAAARAEWCWRSVR